MTIAIDAPPAELWNTAIGARVAAIHAIAAREDTPRIDMAVTLARGVYSMLHASMYSDDPEQYEIRNPDASITRIRGHLDKISTDEHGAYLVWAGRLAAHESHR